MEYETTDAEIEGLGEDATESRVVTFDEEVAVPLGSSVNGNKVTVGADTFIAVFADSELDGKDALIRGTERLNEVVVYISNDDYEIGENVYVTRGEFEDTEVGFAEAADSDSDYTQEDIEMAELIEPISMSS
jgi:acetyltransferase-like isoleucine patch superfamily enzyme